jgi:hypothetical protein
MRLVTEVNLLLDTRGSAFRIQSAVSDFATPVHSPEQIL